MGAGRTRKGQFTSNREKRWTDPDTEGGFQVSRQGEQGEGEQGEQGEQRGTRGTRGTGEPCTYVIFVPYMYAMNE
jgi:hypothetical protein